MGERWSEFFRGQEHQRIRDDDALGSGIHCEHGIAEPRNDNALEKGVRFF